MKNTIKYFIFVSIIITIVVLLYFFYEKPIQDNKEESKGIFLNIYATENGKYVITGYKIFTDNYLFLNGKTLDSVPVAIEAEYNKSFYIYNYNLEGQYYYSYIIDDTTYSSDNKRVNLILEKSENLNIIKNGSLDDDNIYFNLTSNNFRGLKYCIKWGPHIIYVKVNNTDNLINKPLGYENYDKCYETNLNLNKNNYYNFSINYKAYTNLDKSDYIELTFFDSNCIKNECNSLKNYTININNI